MLATRNEIVSAAVPILGTIPLPHMPQHGPHARPSASIDQVRQNSSTKSIVRQLTYDYNGNIVPN